MLTAKYIHKSARLRLQTQSNYPVDEGYNHDDIFRYSSKLENCSNEDENNLEKKLKSYLIRIKFDF